MSQKIFTDESLSAFVNEIKNCANNAVSNVIPNISSSDAGKFLRVSSNGSWIVTTVDNAEEVKF